MAPDRPPARPPAPGRRDSGFTLLEILAALVVLGFVLAMLSQGADFGLRAWVVQARAVRGVSDLDATDRTLRGLIERMNPGKIGGPAVNIAGDAHRFTFRTVLPEAAAGLPTREAEVTIAADRQALVLAWRPYYANRLVDRPPVKTVLVNGVDHLDFSYWSVRQGPDGAPLPAGWSSAYTNAVPPELVRIRIVFDRPDRLWPDIVVAPMRERQRL